MSLPDMDERPSVRQISAAIASGSTEAFAVFYDAWFDRCLESTMRMTGFDESTALDIVQETMMTVATRLPRFTAERQLEAWLDRVILNKARDWIRAESRRRKREQRPLEAGPEPPPLDELEELDRRLEILDERQRSILQLRFGLGWSLHRIGDALGLGGTGSVDGRVRRAPERLREEYRHEEIEDAR